MLPGRSCRNQTRVVGPLSYGCAVEEVSHKVSNGFQVGRRSGRREETLIKR